MQLANKGLQAVVQVSTVYPMGLRALQRQTWLCKISAKSWVDIFFVERMDAFAATLQSHVWFRKAHYPVRQIVDCDSTPWSSPDILIYHIYYIFRRLGSLTGSVGGLTPNPPDFCAKLKMGQIDWKGPQKHILSQKRDMDTSRRQCLTM